MEVIKKIMNEEVKEEVEQKEEGVEEETEVSDKKIGKKVSRDKYEAALKELEKANAEKNHWKNEYYKGYADLQNLRKAIEEEKRVAIRYRSEGFLENLLPALNSFHSALENPPSSEEVRNYLIGFQYIYNSIVKVLNDEGIGEISPKEGDEFNPSLMEAIDIEEREDIEPNRITKVCAKGYKLHDRLIQPAKVYVSKKKEVAEEKPAEPVEENKEENIEANEA